MTDKLFRQQLKKMESDKIFKLYLKRREDIYNELSVRLKKLDEEFEEIFRMRRDGEYRTIENCLVEDLFPYGETKRDKNIRSRTLKLLGNAEILSSSDLVSLTERQFNQIVDSWNTAYVAHPSSFGPGCMSYLKKIMEDNNLKFSAFPILELKREEERGLTIRRE